MSTSRKAVRVTLFIGTNMLLYRAIYVKTEKYAADVAVAK